VKQMRNLLEIKSAGRYCCLVSKESEVSA